MIGFGSGFTTVSLPAAKRVAARARWFVCGNFETESWASQKVYTAVADGVSLRTFCTLVTALELKRLRYDFVLGFLNAEIPKDHVYDVEQPRPTSEFTLLNSPATHKVL